MSIEDLIYIEIQKETRYVTSFYFLNLIVGHFILSLPLLSQVCIYAAYNLLFIYFFFLFFSFIYFFSFISHIVWVCLYIVTM